MRVKEKLGEEFGLHITDLQRVESFGGEVYRAQWDGGSVFVKIGKKDSHQVEIAVYDLLRENGILVPDVIACKESAIGDRSAMVLRALAGYQLGLEDRPSDMSAALCADSSRILKKLHSIRLDGFGNLALHDGRLRGGMASWQEYVLDHYGGKRSYKYVKENNLVSASDFGRLEQAFEAACSANCGKGVFLHNDYHGDHIFTDGSRITGIIDFEKSLAGDFRYDLARTLYFQNKTERETFRSAYGEGAEDPIVADYMILIAAGKIRWIYNDSLEGLKAGALKRFDNAIAYAQQR